MHSIFLHYLNNASPYVLTLHQQRDSNPLTREGRLINASVGF